MTPEQRMGDHDDGRDTDERADGGGPLFAAVWRRCGNAEEVEPAGRGDWWREEAQAGSVRAGCRRWTGILTDPEKKNIKS